MQKFAKFFVFYLHISKKCSTFALRIAVMFQPLPVQSL